MKKSEKKSGESMVCSCDDSIDIYTHICCGDLKFTEKKFKFDPVSKKLFDEFDNFLGIAEIDEEKKTMKIITTFAK
jgi:hypothetical protein